MGTQSANASGSSRVARWRRIRALVSIVGIALLSGVVDHGWARKADAGTAPVHDVAVVPLDDGFETGTTFRGAVCSGCESFFHPVTSDAHTGSQSFFAPDSAMAGFVIVNSSSVVIPQNASAADLTFWQRFEFEHNVPFNYDGGVLELTTDSTESSWVDAGPHITAGGYTGTIEQRGGVNPLEGRAAWVGDSSGWHQVTVDLMAYRGQSLTFRLQMGTDNSNNSPVGGWWVDDFRVTYRAPLTACGRDWNALTSHPAGAERAATASVGSDLYAFSGSTGGGLTAAAYRYSPENDSWDPIAPLPEGRYGAGAVSDGRYIYILGGLAGGDGSPTSSLWRYDPAANSYLTLAPFKIPTAYHAAVYLDGTIYKIAGQASESSDTFTPAVEAYSVADNAWSTVADYPETIGDLAAVAIDGYIYTVGGRRRKTALKDTYRYDAESDSWDTGPIADLPVGASVASGTFYNRTWIVSADGALLGWDPRTNIWRSLDQAPSRLAAPALSVIGNAAYMLGSVPDTIPDETPLLQYVERNCACLGDCGGDGTVSVSELVKGVGIALRVQPLSGCMAFDGDGDGNVAVNELVTAVGNALHGCGGA